MFVTAGRFRPGQVRPLIAIGFFSSLLFTGSLAQADMIRYAYTGTITAADPSTGVAVGTSFSGTFAYNPDAISGAAPTRAGSALYYFGQATVAPGSTADGSGLTVNVGTRSIYDSTGGVSVGLSEIDRANQYGSPAGPQTHVGITNLNVDSSPVLTSLDFTNTSRGIYQSLAPPAWVSLTDFNSATMSVTSNSGSNQGALLYQGKIDSLIPIPAPEPATLTIFAAAAIALYVRSRRRVA